MIKQSFRAIWTQPLYMLCITRGKPFTEWNRHTCFPNQHINFIMSSINRLENTMWAARFSPHKSSRSFGDGRALTQHHRNVQWTLSSFSLNWWSYNKKERDIHGSFFSGDSVGLLMCFMARPVSFVHAAPWSRKRSFERDRSSRKSGSEAWKNRSSPDWCPRGGT